MEAVSIGIPTIGREETLPMVLSAIGFQDYPVDEVILLDEGKKPITENFAIRQVMDFLSLKGIRVVYLRDRNGRGIGAARLRLAEEARNRAHLQVDDDVVMDPSCLRKMMEVYELYSPSWVVPTCKLIPADFAPDGYIDRTVDPDEPEVRQWTEKYPWFVPYFVYDRVIDRSLVAAGTQCILFDKQVLYAFCSSARTLGNLPREDTYITTKSGPGRFISTALCFHYEHASQNGRANWSDSMFYRLHQAAIEDPDKFVDCLGKDD